MEDKLFLFIKIMPNILY